MLSSPLLKLTQIMIFILFDLFLIICPSMFDIDPPSPQCSISNAPPRQFQFPNAMINIPSVQVWKGLYCLIQGHFSLSQAERDNQPKQSKSFFLERSVWKIWFFFRLLLIIRIKAFHDLNRKFDYHFWSSKIYGLTGWPTDTFSVNYRCKILKNIDWINHLLFSILLDAFFCTELPKKLINI